MSKIKSKYFFFLSNILVICSLVFTFYGNSLAEEYNEDTELDKLIESTINQQNSDSSEELSSKKVNSRDQNQHNRSEIKPKKPITSYDEQENLETMQVAEFYLLNKITTKRQRISLSVGKMEQFNNLSLELAKCMRSTDPYTPNHLMLLTIIDRDNNNELVNLSTGWLMTNSPSLSTFEHPVYEIIPIRCK